MKCDRLVCVVTHNRKHVVDLWLKAWNNAEKCGARVAVLHAFDGDEPNEEESRNILKHNPDFYIPYKNTKLRDMQALTLVLEGSLDLPEWNHLFWFTDDMLPMRRSFLRPFVDKIDDPKVGLVAQCYEPRTMQGGGAHIRTVAYAINKDVGNRLRLPNVGSEEDRPYMFEHGRPGVYEDHILNQVLAMGYEFKLAHSEPESPNYQHWTSFLDWMWDCHLLGSWTDMWKVYESQFEKYQPWYGLDSRSDCLLSIREFEERTSVRGKVSAIIPTSSAPIEYFMWSVFSLLLRSDPDVLEHVLIGINGPDERTGSTELQDKKQKFTEELRSMKWLGKDMPMTLVRTWSRVGHAQMLDQCVPWVHTEFYLSMHDDIIVTSKEWGSELADFSDRSLAMKVSEEILGHPLWSAENRLELPHVDTSFSLCRKSSLRDSGASWRGYYLPMNFHIGNLANYEKFAAFHDEQGLCSNGRVWPGPVKDKEYSVLSVDIGGMMIYELIRKGHCIGSMNAARSVHFRGKSWDGSGLDSEQKKHVEALETELEGWPEFKSLYLKYLS